MQKNLTQILTVCLLSIFLTGTTVTTYANKYGGSSMKLLSNSFSHDQTIPSKYTCDGDDISPELHWEDVPPGTKSFVLICDDPDAPMGTWVHWILYNLPATQTSLAENLQTLPANTLVGINSWGRKDYGGPCPPSGTHRYFFKLYALNKTIDTEGMTSQKLQIEMKTHTLARAELVGLYQRE